MGGLITQTSTFKTDINISILMNQTSNIWQVCYTFLLSFKKIHLQCVSLGPCVVLWVHERRWSFHWAPVLSFTSLSSSHVFVHCLSSWHSSNNASLCTLCFSSLPSLPIPFLQLELPNSFSVKRDWFFLRQLQNCSALQHLYMCVCAVSIFFC